MGEGSSQRRRCPGRSTVIRLVAIEPERSPEILDPGILRTTCCIPPGCAGRRSGAKEAKIIVATRGYVRFCQAVVGAQGRKRAVRRRPHARYLRLRRGRTHLAGGAGAG